MKHRLLTAADKEAIFSKSAEYLHVLNRKVGFGCRSGYDIIEKYGLDIMANKPDLEKISDSIDLHTRASLPYQHFYAKTGFTGDETIVKIFSKFEKTAMSGKYDNGNNVIRSRATRPFLINIGKEDALMAADNKQREKFYVNLSKKIATGLERVPEYAADEYISRLIAEIKTSSDPKYIYGKDFCIDKIGTKQTRILAKRAMFIQTDLIGNISRFWGEILFDKNKRKSPVKIPLFLPIINLEWPPVYAPNQIEEVTACLESYADKRPLVKTENWFKTDETKLLTEDEQQLAEEAKIASTYFLDFCNKSICSTPMIVVGPTWFIGAIPHGTGREAWLGTHLNNNSVLEDAYNHFKYDGIKII